MEKELTEGAVKQDKANIGHAKKVKDYNGLDMNIKHATPRRKIDIQSVLVRASELMHKEKVEERKNVTGREFLLFN